MRGGAPPRLCAKLFLKLGDFTLGMLDAEFCLLAVGIILRVGQFFLAFSDDAPVAGDIFVDASCAVLTAAFFHDFARELQAAVAGRATFRRQPFRSCAGHSLCAAESCFGTDKLGSHGWGLFCSRWFGRRSGGRASYGRRGGTALLCQPGTIAGA